MGCFPSKTRKPNPTRPKPELVTRSISIGRHVAPPQEEEEVKEVLSETPKPVLSRYPTRLHTRADKQTPITIKPISEIHNNINNNKTPFSPLNADVTRKPPILPGNADVARNRFILPENADVGRNRRNAPIIPDNADVGRNRRNAPIIPENADVGRNQRNAPIVPETADVSEASEISVSTVPEEEFSGEVRRRVTGSPANNRQRSSSGYSGRVRSTGPSPSRVRERNDRGGSLDRVGSTSVRERRRRERGSGEMMYCGKGGGRLNNSPSIKKNNGKGVVKIGSETSNSKVEDGGGDESLENPLVSLECFIFL